MAREKVTIMTKTSASTEKEMRAELDRYRREMGTDYIDILLLHCMLDADWPERKKGAMAVISEAREKGIVKTHGTSCHTLDALKTAARTPWVQVDLARINPAGVAMDADPQTEISVLRQMKAAGKGIIGMKILGAGKLRDKADECLQFALSLDCVDCMTIGSESRGEIGRPGEEDPGGLGARLGETSRVENIRSNCGCCCWPRDASRSRATAVPEGESQVRLR